MKRLFDISLSLLVLLIFALPMAVVYVLVRTFLGSPALFSQVRPGLNGQPFKMYKFRTMTNKRDSEGHLLPDEQRLTRFGKLLRSTSLDELPEILNILKGDMSFVGPRPLLVEYLPLYSEEQKRRHHVRPGLTGWAQVNGRNSISWEQKFALDVWYVDHQSFVLDLKILILTFKKVFIREGIDAKSGGTMPPFKGNV